ncbi:hypothetical protein BJ166DRAFT_143588 [Pestalotiopsis sp. NC0098]|nr:hypothetical protein BJ166DRAFT_143588 [Pestalotiopsis sp. NC0098]
MVDELPYPGHRDMLSFFVFLFCTLSRGRTRGAQTSRTETGSASLKKASVAGGQRTLHGCIEATCLHRVCSRSGPCHMSECLSCFPAALFEVIAAKNVPVSQIARRLRVAMDGWMDGCA